MSKKYWDDKHLNIYSKSDWAYKPSIFSKQAIGYFPKSGMILEIGSGQGGDADYFKSLGYEVTATDYSETAINHASQRLQNVNFLNIDTAEGLSFNDESFDVVYSHMALHYFSTETTKKIFTEIYRVLKPGGIFATITNTIDDPEKEVNNYKQLDKEFFLDPKGIRKRYFSTKSLSYYTNNLFETLLLDNKGTTHKDKISSLIRFIGKKK